MHQALENWKGVKVIADDILVYGTGKDRQDALGDHDQNLRDLLNRCRSEKIKINKDKVKFRLNQLPYMGHGITSEGLKPDPKKIEAVQNMSSPKDV